jgi:predicted O-methyltransferase YrrM
VAARLRGLPPAFLSVYSLHRETAAWLYRLVAAERPRRIVEAGCGISTVLTARALEAAGAPADPTAFVSLEAEETWLGATAEVLASLGLADRVSLRIAPLVDMEWNGRVWRSYDPAASADLADVDQLLVDGPPKAVGRAPVLGLLHPRLRPGGRIILDDARRPGERAALDMWEELGLARVVGHLPIGNGITILETL